MPVQATERISGRSLVSKELFEFLVARIVRHERINRALAEDIANQALVAMSPGVSQVRR